MYARLERDGTLGLTSGTGGGKSLLVIPATDYLDGKAGLQSASEGHEHLYLEFDVSRHGSDCM